MRQITDTYQTIKDVSEGVYKDRGSSFIARAVPVINEKDIKWQIEQIKKEHHAARHHCYAYILGVEGLISKANDDGEPSGSAGPPILNQIRSKQITNVMVLVTRYFGGKKLGVSGLVTAYKTAAKEALDKAQIITKTIMDLYQIEFAYADTNEVMKIFNEYEVRQVSKDFDTKCRIGFSVRKSKSDHIFHRIGENKKFKIRYLSREFF